MRHSPDSDQTRAAVRRLIALVLGSATLLAACGGSATPVSATSSTSSSGTTTSAAPSVGASTSTTGASSTIPAAVTLPPPCSLITVAQASAALGATVNEVKPTYVGSKIGCNWTVAASSLVKGLGSNIVLGLLSPPSVPRSSYYKEIEAQPALHFEQVTIAGIPAVAGFGADNVVEVDVGPTVVDVGALSTASAGKDSTAAEQAATDAVEALCRKISCER